jgi:hypothetical protein
MIGCLYNVPKKLEDSQSDSSVKGSFRVTLMRFRLQRWSLHLDVTRLVKRAITDMRKTPHHAMKIP